ncbi:MAG: hypothetical protein ABIP21_03150 [Acidimicrobiia bacterium]
MSDPQPRPAASNEPEVEPVAGDGITQEAVDAAMQEAETPDDATNEG